jgi:hypothetical protein
VPYHVLILDDELGTAEQLIPLSVRGTHASGYNRMSWAIAVVCEGRAPSVPQRARLVRVMSALSPANGGLTWAGHCALPGASADPNKSCPGPWIDAATLAGEARSTLPADWRTWDLMVWGIGGR